VRGEGGEREARKSRGSHRPSWSGRVLQRTSPLGRVPPVLASCLTYIAREPGRANTIDNPDRTQEGGELDEEERSQRCDHMRVKRESGSHSELILWEVYCFQWRADGGGDTTGRYSQVFSTEYLKKGIRAHLMWWRASYREVLRLGQTLLLLRLLEPDEFPAHQADSHLQPRSSSDTPPRDHRGPPGRRLAASSPSGSRSA